MRLFRFLPMILSLMLLLSLCAFADDIPTVFVSACGNDSGNGSENDPFLTIGTAIEAVSDGGRIVFMDEYTFGEYNDTADKLPCYTEPEHSGEITFTSKTDTFDFRRTGAAICFPESAVWRFGGDVVLENISLKSGGNEVYFVGNFHAMTFDEGFEAVNTGGSAKFLFAIGGYMAPTAGLAADRDVNITVKNGNFKRLIAFGYIKGAATYTFTGTAHLTVTGGHIDRIYGGSTLNHYAGSLDMVVTGGSLGEIYTAGDATRRLLGNAHVELRGGTITTFFVNNVLGDTDILLDGATFRSGGKISVTYGSDALRDSAYGKKIALTYNSGLYDAAFVNTFTGLTSITRFGSLYVQSGSHGDGNTADHPMNDLAEAIRALANGGGDIHILGEYSLRDFTEPEHTEPITLCGESGVLNLSGNYTLSGNTAFDALTLAGNAQIDGGSHALTLGETLRTSGKMDLAGSRIAVNGGQWNAVRAESLRIGGGKIQTLSGYGEFSLSLSGGELISAAIDAAQNATLTVSGGKFGKIALSGIGGAIRVHLAGGEIGDLTLQKGGASATLLYDPLVLSAATVEKITPLFDTVTAARVCYVRDGGGGDGLSPDAPLPSLEAAFSALAGGDGVIVVCGEVTISAATAMAEGTHTVTITSQYDGVDYRETGAAIVMRENIGFYCPTVLDHLHFVSAKSSNVFLVFDGYKAVIGEDVTCEKAPNATTHISLVGGTRRNNYPVHKTDLTVNGGSWYWGYSGNTAAADFPDLECHMTIGGGTFEGRVVAAGAGNQSGTAALTVNGGVLLGSIYGISCLATETYTGEITITVNGGEIHGKITPATRHNTTLNGKYTVHLCGGDFRHLTDIEGKEKYTLSQMTATVHIAENLDITRAESGTITYQNPIRKTADPRIAWVNGVYYYVFTSGQTLSVYKASNVTDLADAVPELVWDARNFETALEGRTKNIWPSELQYFSPEEFGAENAGWYLFFSTYLPTDADSGKEDGSNRRSYVLKCTSDDLQGDWANPVTGEIGVPEKFTSDTDPDVNNIDWCAGESTLRYNGKIYALWIEQRGRMSADFRQILYLSELKNPWTVTGKVLSLVEPIYDWEREGFGYSEAEGIWYPAVIEGATPIVGDNDELFVLYAASGYWTTGYKIGQMTYLGGDLLAIENWEKSPTSIFQKNSEVNGVGGLSAFVAPDGTGRYILYHGYLGKDTSSGRYCFMEPYTVDRDGVHFGVDGHPSPLASTLSIPINTTPLADKIHGFDNYSGKVTVKLKLNTTTAYVNGAHKALDAAPVIRKDRTMLPVRFLAESLGASVGWDGATSTATLTDKDGTIITITVGADHLCVNGTSVPLDSPAYIDPATNRTYLPVRAIAEALGASVGWDGTTSTATLSKIVR